MATSEWLRYANQGATRNRPLSPQLVDAFSRFLPQMGVTAEVFSGGQPTAGEGGGRTGSVRHDHGNAGDVFFLKDGRRLDWANPQDLPLFKSIVQQGKEAGLTGFGAGPGYMQPGSMHVGFGHPGVWGAGGVGRNAPAWLVEAYGGAPVEKALPSYGSLMASSTPTAPTPGAPAGGTQTPANVASLFAAPTAPSALQAPGTALAAPQQPFGQIALLFAQQQAQRQQQRQEEADAEQERKKALFSADSLAGLFGAA